MTQDSRRNDILAELGLSPRWVLRGGQSTALPSADGDLPEETTPKVAPLRRGMPKRVALEAGLRGTVSLETPAPAASEPAAFAGAASAPAAPPAPSRAPLPPPESTDTEAAEARLTRIAALDWSAFAADVAACTACKLCRTRHKVVPGVGDPNADWLFVGEAPGQEEDARGEPFVGQAGRLLDNMLAALGLARSRRVYIANVLKCRPPNNRTPEPAEADACSPYLARQIELIQPKVVVALGKTAASLLLATDASVASLRGRVHRYRGLPLVVTYHPAYLLRTLSDKAKAWEDLVFARAVVEREGGTIRS